jgi:hypothetical protein
MLTHQQVFDLVQRQAAMSQLDRSAFWNRVDCIGRVREDGKLLPLTTHLSD